MRETPNSDLIPASCYADSLYTTPPLPFTRISGRENVHTLIEGRRMIDRKKYRTYTQEFKLQALELLERSNKTASERELGITTGMLLKWKQRNKFKRRVAGRG